MPSALDQRLGFDPGPFSQPEWSDSSDSVEPSPLPQLGYFVPVRCRCGHATPGTRHVCRRNKRESPRSRRSVSQCSCNSMSRRSSAAASPMPLPPLNNTVEMYVEPVVEDVSRENVVCAECFACLQNAFQAKPHTHHQPNF